MFTKGQLGGEDVLLLAPLAVLPHYQNQAVGTCLIQEGHRIAIELGFQYVFVLGNPAYYSKFGYIHAKNNGVTPPFDGLDDYFMIYFLTGVERQLDGILHYPAEFGMEGENT